MKSLIGGLALFALLTFAALAAPPGSDGPLPPRVAPRRMTLPEGFTATLFAGEPDVVQPIAFAFDPRGRLWVAECHSYPKWLSDRKAGTDRLLIFEDTDGDGHFDKRTVFHRKLANVSGLAVGFGGVWVCATPHLLFIPDRNRDDVPDGEPIVVLDGWDLKAQHNVVNGLAWGPDGWLWGCNGILSKSLVGAPGTPARERVALNCGVWRYHPVAKRIEAVAHGTTNPWGLDFDAHGEAFITNCVIHHLWHVVPGAHFQRMFGEDINPHNYGLLPSVADHIHWGGGHWTSSRGGQGSHSEAGGGHAHSGAMIYLGDNWPARFRGGAFTCNIHGNRLNHDILERRGSTYVARHGRDFLLANDPWFRGLAVQLGPDGAAYVSDWCDTGECHNYQVADTSNGRIYRVSYGKPTPFREDLAKLSDAELVKRQLHPNEWHVRQARLLLQERAAAGTLDPKTAAALKTMLARQPNDLHRLRALWALHGIGAADESLLLAQTHAPAEDLRVWAVRLAVEGRSASAKLLARLVEMAASDPAPRVRLALASALQRLPIAQRDPIARALIRHQEDADDLYLPLMYWYGIEPIVAAAGPSRAGHLLKEARIPLLREYVARRLLALPGQDATLNEIVHGLADIDEPPLHRDVLRGVQEALSGRRSLPMPAHWKQAYPALSASPLPEVRERALALAVQFGDERAFKALRTTVENAQAPASTRHSALATLLFKHTSDLVPLLHKLLDDPALRAQAARGLAAFDDPATPRLLLKQYAKWNAEERADALATLASRPAYAQALLDAVGAGAVPRGDVSAFTVRQLHALKNPDVTRRLEKVWGKVRPASREKAALLKKHRAALTTANLKNANLSHGRALYVKQCAACHRLFGTGGDVGPDLTGSQRANLDYVLENVLDPSAIVPREYQVHVLTTKAGRVLTGIIKQETDRAVVVQTQNERLTVPRDEIEERSASAVSMMPEGLLDSLRAEEVRDLIAYLASPGQVPLPAGRPAK